MALPAIEEDTKMQSELCHVMFSPVSSSGARNRAPSLSPRSSTSGEILPKTSPKAQTFSNLRSPWKHFDGQLRLELEDHNDEDFVPIRRRFYSSDIIIRSSGGVSANFINFFERGGSNRNKVPHGYGYSGDDEFEPEPLAEPDHLVFRRRTCSENFTKSSRVPPSFFQKENSFYDVDLKAFDHRQRWTRQQVGDEEEYKEDEEYKKAADHFLVDFRRELETEDVERAAEEQAIDDFYDDSWTSPTSGVLQAGIYSGNTSKPAPNDEIRSDGQNLEKLRNLQKLYQEGFITVTEYKDRRVQLVDELGEADQTIANTSDLLSLELPIVYREPPDFSVLRERDAIKHIFDSENRTWTSLRIKVKIDAEPFANGGLRQVFHLQDLSMPSAALNVDGDIVISKCTSYVAKIAIDPNENPDTYFKDVEMQAVAAKYAKLYNTYNPPRRVEFLEACILQLIPTLASDAGDQTIENLTLSGTICGVEPFIAGEYHKHNNNFGYVSELERNTPQAFSHFTYEASGQQILVVDIQGVGDHYTDPQIHSRRGKEFGKGNLALRGFERFLSTHRCNPICRYLKLPLINPKDEGSRQVDPKGTIPAQTYMSQPHVAVDRVDSFLCHYYGDLKAFKRYTAKKKRERKKRETHKRKSHSRSDREKKWQAQEVEVEVASEHEDDESVENAVGVQQPGNRFAAALVDQHRSCSPFVCDGVSQCIVS